MMASPDQVLRAVNAKSSAADVLRLCLQLPAGTSSAEFLAWAKELDGYAGEDKLPDYRIADLESHGAAMNPVVYYSDVPVSGLPVRNETLQNWMARPYRILEGVASIEDLVEQASEGGDLAVEWPFPAVQLLNAEVQAGQLGVDPSFVFQNVWKSMPRGRLVEILDRVLTRVTAELAPLAPASPSTPAVTSTADTGITVTGSHNQLVVQSPGSTQWQLSLETGDVDALLDALQSEGVGQEPLAELREIVSSRDAEEHRLKRALEWAKTQALTTPASVGSGILTGIILRHFGLG